ncbi:hypothetical protein BC938DRAFT_482980 [Jimgerdemannia flammicorona]|uniref:Uncharacterized protein n=1 Tax=Jimgerdemannia flammicorona TaxID=994334 RepID=A0A433QW43_9FUNG|nr:hypothetical protein BC938DRAFT_482980 [Jimgerdemannia flammicorona]
MYQGTATGDLVHEEQDNVGDNKGVRHSSTTIGKLIEDLNEVPVDPPTGNGGRAVERDNSIIGEDTGEKDANEPTNTVNGENVESVIIVERQLQLAGEVADNTASDTEDDGRCGPDITGGGGDGDEADNGAAAETDCRELVVEAIGNEAGHGSADATGFGGAAIEAEPAEPQEGGAEDDVRHIVGLELIVFVTCALTEDKGVCEGGSAGTDVDGSAAGEVETSQPF